MTITGSVVASAPNDIESTAAAPFGLFGLVLSCVAILAAAALACCLVAAAVFGMVVVAIGFDRALDLVTNLDPSGGRDKTFFVQFNIAAGLVIYAVTSGSILAAARWRGGSRWRDLVAWRRWSPFHGARLFWAVLALTLVYSLAADALVEHLHPASRNWTPSPSGTLWDILFVGLAAVMAPITEELFFRGWVYTALRPAMGVVAGIGVTSVLFALAHWEDTHLYALAIFPVGLALGFVRERTGSIAASIAFHALYNGFASVLLLSK